MVFPEGKHRRVACWNPQLPTCLELVLHQAGPCRLHDGHVPRRRDARHMPQQGQPEGTACAERSTLLPARRRHTRSTITELATISRVSRWRCMRWWCNWRPGAGAPPTGSSAVLITRQAAAAVWSVVSVKSTRSFPVATSSSAEGQRAGLPITQRVVCGVRAEWPTLKRMPGGRLVRAVHLARHDRCGKGSVRPKRCTVGCEEKVIAASDCPLPLKPNQPHHTGSVCAPLSVFGP